MTQPSSGNRIKALIERRLLTPAYAGMLAGLLVRGIALVLSVAIPYASWPVVVRIGIEGCAAIGMIGCADIVLSAASAAWAAVERQIDSVRNSPEYTANPRLAPAKFAQAQAMLDARRALVLTGLEREKSRERLAVFFCGAVTVSYGILFGVTVMARASFVTIAVEVIGVAAIPFVTWYLSAQYREEQPEPEEQAKALSLVAVAQRLQAAHDRLASGAETEGDISLLDVATESSAYHNRLVRSLRKQDDRDTYLTTPQLYALLGVTDSSGQASIRRIVRKAGDAKAYGVIRDSKSDAWLTPRKAVIDLFPQFIGGGTGASKPRTLASKPRTPAGPATALQGANSGQGSDSVRTHGEPHRGVIIPGMPGREGVRLAEPLR